jgi:hypothetical protein
MTFARVPAADLAAMACALLLLFVMGLDWYSTTAGDEARRIERFTEPQGALGGEVSRDVEERARESAEDAERNALQVSGAIDRIILVGLLGTVILALAAGFLRAAGKRFEPPLTPSALAAVCACVTALLVAYRMIEQPGLDAGTTVKAGAPAALVVLGLTALICTAALRAEEAGTAWREPVAAGPADAAAGGEAAGGEASIESTR